MLCTSLNLARAVASCTPRVHATYTFQLKWLPLALSSETFLGARLLLNVKGIAKACECVFVPRGINVFSNLLVSDGFFVVETLFACIARVSAPNLQIHLPFLIFTFENLVFCEGNSILDILP